MCIWARFKSNAQAFLCFLVSSNSQQKKNANCLISLSRRCFGERGGSVVECRTPEREVRGSRPTAAVLCPWARHFTPRKYWLITQEAMAPSRHDWKIVDWDVKPQHNQKSPVLHYSSEIWGLHAAKEIVNVYAKFLRKILGVGNSTNLTGLYGETDRVSLQIIRKVHMFRYWIKILQLNESSLLNTYI